MSQSGYTPIQLYRTTTAAATPSAGNLAAGELAINLTDEKLYFKNAAGTVKLLASTDTLGTVTSVAVSGGTTGLTTSGGPITTSGTITLAGTLGVANGGTGTTTAFTAGSVVFAGASGAYSQDNANFFWDDTNNRLGIGTVTPSYRLEVTGSASALRVNGTNTGTDVLASFAGRGVLGVDAPGVANGRFILTDGGLVGIGTNSPTNNLTVYNGTSRTLIRAASDLNFAGAYLGTATSTNRGASLELLTHVDGSNSTGWRTAVSVDLFGGTGDLVFSFAGNSSTYAGLSYSEKMRLDINGNLGIGTSAPTVRADILGVGVASSAVQPLLQLRSASDALSNSVEMLLTPIISGQTRTAIGGVREGATANAAIYMATNNAERMRITSAGDVGIGTSSPGTKLDILGAGNPTLTLRGSDAAYSGIVNIQAAGGGTSLINATGGSNILGLYTNTVERMRIDSSGNVGIGTSAPGAKLDVLVADGAEATKLRGATGRTRIRPYVDATSGSFIDAVNTAENAYIPLSLAGSSIRLTTNGGLAATVDASGNVGIGTPSPATKLHLLTPSATAVALRAGNSVSYAEFQVDASGNSQLVAPGGVQIFNTNGAERMRIDSSGNVGIGTSSPSQKLSVGGGGNVVLTGASTGDQSLKVGAGRSGNGYSFIDLQGDTTYDNGLRIIRTNGGANTPSNIEHRGTGALALITQEAGPIAFLTSATERMRINASGNVGIGTASPASTLHVVGQEIRIQAPTFPKVIWNASTNGTDLKKWQAYVDNGGTFKIAALNDAENAELGTYQLDRTFFAFGVDNTASVGTASVRWSVIYAATGTINTSDEREKEWRSGLTESELRASKRIVADLGFYRWVDAIAEKGDEARYHFGARAQQVWAIMADEGLVDPIIDGIPGDTPYAFLCFDQWDEAPEVPAVEEVLGEDGEVVVDARAAIPAKPAGNRFGLRVDQLTMFLIAAQEQRLAALEALL
jgi:hypothetical protein